MAEYSFAIKKLRSTRGAHFVTARELATTEKFYQQTINRSLTRDLVARGVPE